jgi:hypothetical protein
LSNSQTDANYRFQSAFIPFCAHGEIMPPIRQLATNVCVPKACLAHGYAGDSAGSSSSTELIVKGMANSRQTRRRFPLHTSEGLTHKTQEVVTCLILQFLQWPGLQWPS